MARQEEKHFIGSKEYTFYQFNATEGLKIWVKLVKVIGAPLGVVINGAVSNKDVELAKLDLSKMSLDVAVKMLADNLEADETVNLIKQIMASVTVEGKRVSEIFDIHFQGEYSLLFKVVYKALEVNYKDFLLEVADKAGIKKAQA